MYISNKAIELYRETADQRRVSPSIAAKPECINASYDLRSCLKENEISVLDHQKAKSACNLGKFYSECNGAYRRYFVEQIYREQKNRSMYTQQEMDKYNRQNVSTQNLRYLH